MSGAEEQPALVPGMVRASVRASQAKARATRARRTAEAEVTDVDPVARVLVDVPLAHLDRPFDYAVPVAMADAARPGVRVKVRFAGQDVDGFVLERVATSEHPGRLAPLRRVVSGEPVLSPEVAALCGEVAERYAGTRADVVRLAVPPRHATVEKEQSPVEPPVPAPGAGEGTGWSAHEHGSAFLARLAGGDAPRGVWSAAPGEDWPARLAEAAAAVRRSGRGVLVCLPDGKDVERVGAAVTSLLGPDHHVTLRADAGPSQRYRDFLAVSRGARRIVVGTRAAAFAPVPDLGLVVVWDDGDDLHAEPRAPYPHARDVLLLRAERQGAAALVAGFARTVEAAYLLRTGWARELAAPRALVRERVRTVVAGASDHDLARDPHARTARIGKQVVETLRSGLETGPVLVQNPRTGYVAALACERCRTPARCRACHGPLVLTGPATPPACRWCGTAAPGWQCSECGHRGLRAPVLGDARTAEELGRALPGARVLTSSAGKVLATVDAAPAVVVATPGAEPVADGGYAAVVLLDAWLQLGRTDLRTEEEALRRWANAVGLVRPGGRALLVGDPAHPAVQALVRWDPGGFAEREAEQRQEAHLPPASRLATVTGAPGAVDDALTLLRLPEVAEVLGPAPVVAAHGRGEPAQGEAEVRVVVRVPRSHGPALARAVGELQRVRSARKLDPVRVQVDPPTL